MPYPLQAAVIRHNDGYERRKDDTSLYSSLLHPQKYNKTPLGCTELLIHRPKSSKHGFLPWGSGSSHIDQLDGKGWCSQLIPPQMDPAFGESSTDTEAYMWQPRYGKCNFLRPWLRYVVYDATLWMNGLQGNVCMYGICGREGGKGRERLIGLILPYSIVFSRLPWVVCLVLHKRSRRTASSTENEWCSEGIGIFLKLLWL